MRCLGHSTRTRYAPAVLALTLVGAAIPYASANEILGMFKSWVAQSYDQDGQPVCMLWSQPESAEGDYTRRGDIYVFLSHRPGEQRRNEIRFEAGYDFQADSAVQVTIDSHEFSLVTDASTAWLTSSAEEDAMVKAMKAGREMVVEGTSSRGTRTRDTYSLYGFTAGHKAINQACTAS